jgi:peptidoglycan/LPS O-acetylase OafA/YrhL
MSERIRELDGLRGVAVLGVLVWHFIGGMVDRDAGILQEMLHAATIFGRTGVDLFFVLSGFLIIGILIDQRSSGNLFKVFYIRRTARIWPPYLILIVMYWLCYWLVGESDGFNSSGGILVQLIAQLTFTWNWLMAITDSGVADGFSVTWSVAIEEWFYLVFPFLIWLTPTRQLPRLLAAVAIASIAMRAGLHLARPQLWLAPYVLTPLRMDGLCAGGLLAWMLRDEVGRAWLVRHSTAITRFAVGFGLSLPLIVGLLIRPSLDTHMYLWGHAYMSAGFVAIIAAVMLRVQADRPVGFLRSRLLGEAGRYSYSLYLFHPLFISLFFTLAGRADTVTDWTTFGLAASALIVSVAFCVALYWTVERKAMGWARGFAYGPPGAAKVLSLA